VVETSDIKNDLPDWPDDVIEQWLHYFAQRCGWPLGGFEPGEEPPLKITVRFFAGQAMP
jgi:hypothetical protein